ncbi:hypothetical protein [Saccharothrix sp. CB00851]|uniref:hypothetical protein n=1 Tax=Saccharothrix sp. CB00851 TaxID=1835005 RepID=UPI0009392B98|nr:hypothetical protein [Saccharothrix sp. CB00851]OKI25737.1 hypothetical protein A6A25_32610 [Saccharothrix sp. CB00851]
MFAAADFSLFIALTHPDADADELDLVTAWHVALWFVDDLFLPLFRRDHDRASVAQGVDDRGAGFANPAPRADQAVPPVTALPVLVRW